MQLAHSTQHRLLGQNVVQRTAQIECNRTNNSQPGTAKSFKKNAREPTKLPRRVLHQVAIYYSYNTTEYEGMAIQHMSMHTP